MWAECMCTELVVSYRDQGESFASLGPHNATVYLEIKHVYSPEWLCWAPLMTRTQKAVVNPVYCMLKGSQAGQVVGCKHVTLADLSSVCIDLPMVCSLNQPQSLISLTQSLERLLNPAPNHILYKSLSLKHTHTCTHNGSRPMCVHTHTHHTKSTNSCILCQTRCMTSLRFLSLQV